MRPQFGLLLFPEVEELDFVGPWEMLKMWERFLDGPACFTVAQHKQPIDCANGLSVNPNYDFANCPPLDFLLVPGGPGTRREVDNSVLVDFVRAQAAGCRVVLSVCTGSFVLHRAGLLAGRRATTHWGSLDRLRALGDVHVVEERNVVDGKLWSSAGVSAGIDMTLAFIAAQAGEEVAMKAQVAAEYFPDGRRYGRFADDPRAPAYLGR
ncbi:MAG: DJ-1/PfpI family protein [Betaproteobacteria bacterium]